MAICRVEHIGAFIIVIIYNYFIQLQNIFLPRISCFQSLLINILIKMVCFYILISQFYS